MKTSIRKKLAVNRRLILNSFISLTLFALPAFGVALRPCAGAGNSLPVGTFRLMVVSPKGGAPLPLNSINVIQPGDKLKYEPVKIAPAIKDKARIALVLLPAHGATGKGLAVLDAKAAGTSAEWSLPLRASVVGVVFGPRGLDVKKVTSLVKKNPDLVPELARYAQKTATVNALVDTLSQYEQSQPGSMDLNAALRGFSAQYGVALPRLSSGASTDQQASILLSAVLPSISNYDPLASGRSAMVQQSAGLAASVASLFYGTPVGLAVGGAALFQNMRTMMFPDTDFRAAFPQTLKSGDVELCAQNHSPRPRTRIAYLWMLRIPDASAPSVSLPETHNLPMGLKSQVKVTCATHDQLRLLPRAHDWQLVSSDHKAKIPVKVEVGATEDTLSLDLTGVKLPAGEYHLAALWDWQPLRAAGAIWLHPFSDFSNVRLTPDSEDHLIAGSGTVKVSLIGADFEFVTGVAIAPAHQSHSQPQDVFFTLPSGVGAGQQLSMSAEVNTTKLQPGAYQLQLTQTDGKTQQVPIVIHPPNPEIQNVPLRVNLGEPQQTVLLRGTNLERIVSLTSPEASFMLSSVPAGAHQVTERKARLKLHLGAHKGDVLEASMGVEEIHKPVKIDDLLQVAGPLPKIVSVNESFPKDGNVALQQGEIPAGSAVSFAMHVQNMDSRPAVGLSCSNDATREALHLMPGDRKGSAQLDAAGAGLLFLSLDPGMVGQSGCELIADVTTEDAGTSNPYPLGKVVRLPQIDKFSLSNERAGQSLYAGVLTGQDLQMIEKTGWNPKAGYPVQGIPTPVPGSGMQQTLNIELPWPPPAPEAPVYVWLRGEDHGRRTNAKY
ncbi:MAG TPA: hypothetical protein VFZ08_06605 [Terriglobia bacterium]|nr:hypothetical protein [Terriglobia bacterium]